MTKISISEIFLNEVVEKLNEIFPEPSEKEASNTTGGTWEPSEKEASNTTGGSFEGEEEAFILNPLIEAQRVLGKVEEVADSIDSYEQKAAALLEVAKVHTQIGKQLLDDFIR